MRRECKTSESYIDWLKSMGCVFYAPLNQGDTKDYFSGNDLIVTNGSVSWDTNQNAYRFYGPPSRNQYVGHWTGLNMPISTTNVEFSILFEVRVAHVWTCPLTLGNRTWAFNMEGAQTNQWFKWASTLPGYDGINHKINWIYLNGTPTNGIDRGTGYATITTAATQSVETQPSGNTSNTNRTYHMRNAMIFNVALTLDQIKEIQQIP